MMVSAIIPVAGRGVRFGSAVPKQFLKIHDQPIIGITIRKFVACAAINNGVVVAAKNDLDETRRILSDIKGFSEKFRIVAGGAQRQDSVYQGLINIPANTDVVVVHDGVRPLVTTDMIERSIHEASASGGCVVAVPVKETIKRVKDHQVLETLPRDQLWQIQTPQTFKYQILYDAHEKAKEALYYSTDEAALVEWAGYPVKIIMGNYSNIKITTPEDLEIAKIFFREELA